MKKISSILLLLVLTFSLNAQYGNEWIDYSQKYYEIKVAEDGLYRIDYNILSNEILTTSSINSADYQIFAKEREVPVFINDGGNGFIDNPGEYIEFYGEKNNGWLDSLMYDNSEGIGNPFYSLVNDTLIYFLTWSAGVHERFAQESDVNFAPHTPRPYFLSEVVQTNSFYYYEGDKPNGNSSSTYDDGEGFTNNHFNGASGNTQTHFVFLSNLYQGVGAPKIDLSVRISSNSAASSAGLGNHHTKIRFGLGGNTAELFDSVYWNYQSFKVNTSIPPNSVLPGSNYFYHDIIGDLGAATDFQLFNFGYVKYPKEPNSGNSNSQIFNIPFDGSLTKSYYEIAQCTAVNPILYCIGTEKYRIPVVQDAGLHKCLIPLDANGAQQKMVLFDESEVHHVSNLDPTGANGSFTNYLNGNLDSLYVIISETSLLSSAQQYADYRTSVNGGEFNTKLIDVNNLYGQFGGGITQHPLAIKRLMAYYYNNSSIKPEGLFLLGKAIGSIGSQGTRKNSTSFQNSLIPTYGYPHSDNLYTQGIDGSNEWSQKVPVGRIAAKTSAEVELYLGKVMAYENHQNQASVYDSESKEWQKQIIHFGGGNTLGEQQSIATKLGQYENIAEGTEFGGTVYTYLQQSSEPIALNVLTELNELIANGTSLLTFYGHAVATGFDVNIDDPENWNNFEKYPFVIGNSCYTGNIHLYNSSSISEDFVFTENAGAIGMMSSVNLGFLSQLYQYTRRFYAEFSENNYGKSVGYQAMMASQNLEASLPSVTYEQTANQMVMHCDPVLKLNYHNKPEFNVTENDIYVTPEEVDLSVVNFDVNVVVTNLGRGIADTINAELTRTYPNGNGDTTFFKTIPGLNFKDTITFSIPLTPNLGIGLNDFDFRIDLPSFIEEQYDESNNNQVSHNFSIKINGITPVFPYNYAVVPRDTVEVRASTIDPIGPMNTYFFEIDTTDTYDSPELRKATISALGGVQRVNYNEWKDGVTGFADSLFCADSTVYFWRVALDSSVIVWQEHSFQYIPGKEGWGQDHFFQFKHNEFNQVDYDRTIRQRKFEPNSAELYCQVYGDGTNLNETEWGMNSQRQEYGICGWTPSLQVVVVDPAFMKAWQNNSDGTNPNYEFGDVTGCRPWRLEKYFTFRQTIPESMDSLETMINNHVPDSHFVFIYAPVKAYYQYWNPSDYAFFQGLGSTEIFDGRTNAPFITFFQKGDPTSFQEVHAVDSTDFINLVVNVTGTNSVGSEISPIIGPASNWETIYWKQDPNEDPSDDTTKLIITGISINGNQDFEVEFTRNDSLLNINSIIDASVYPYLQLQSVYEDETTTTPAQMDRWHVLYSPVPEMAIDGSNGYYFSITDSITEGETFELALDMVNISDWPMDSLLVHYYLEDEHHNLHYLPYPRQDSLRVAATIRDTLIINTFGFPGFNSIWVEANPYTQSMGLEKDQLEQYHFNNILQIPFYVKYDDINPILDVTFDGNHIINGDIVSPKSEIVITLKDENPLLVMDSDKDTSKFVIYLTDPQGIQKRIYFYQSGQNQLQWIPADASNLKFKIIYTGDFQLDGTYNLLVQGSDLSGNLSGDSEYKIAFEVISKSTITHLMNYPNPFSTSTKFVFTLTGSQVPDNMIIQILSVTGKVVREITQDELGLIQIGRNITDYAWDGKDMFGDQLANGVYLYRVLTNLEGETIEHRTTGADQYFKRGFGKMYLIR